MLTPADKTSVNAFRARIRSSPTSTLSLLFRFLGEMRSLSFLLRRRTIEYESLIQQKIGDRILLYSNPRVACKDGSGMRWTPVNYVYAVHHSSYLYSTL